MPLLRIHWLEYLGIAIIPKRQGLKATKSSYMTIVGQAADSGTPADSHYGNIAGLQAETKHAWQLTKNRLQPFELLLRGDVCWFCSLSISKSSHMAHLVFCGEEERKGKYNLNM